jgi:hypothetical protein
MRKTILSLLGSTLIVASMANAAMAAQHLTRHHQTYASERVRHAHGWYSAYAFWPKDQNPFGTVLPWPTGRIPPDDSRQFGNGL